MVICSSHTTSEFTTSSSFMAFKKLPLGISTRSALLPQLPEGYPRVRRRLREMYALLWILGAGLVQTAAAEFVATFPEGTRTVTLPKMDTPHRLYLRATATEPARLRVTVSAGFLYPIGQFRVAASAGAGSPDWFPLTDAAGEAVVLPPNANAFGAQVRYEVGAGAPMLPRLLELKLVTTQEEPSRPFVAWVSPSPGSFGAASQGPVVVEIGPGQSSVSSTVFILNQSVPWPFPQTLRNVIGGLTLTYPSTPSPTALGDGHNVVEVAIGDRLGTRFFSWGFHVGEGPGVFATAAADGGLDLHFVGTLESASSPAGPFEPVADAVSPHRIQADDLSSMGYFRAVR